MDFKQFLASGKTIITDTMAPKSELPKVPKGKKISVEKEQTTIADPLENLIKRVVDEDVKKLEVVEVFKKIIDQEEAKI
jgi:hypothetical protein